MRAVAVDQYTLDGKFVKTWDKISKVNVASSSIYAVIKGNKEQAGGYKWKKHIPETTLTDEYKKKVFNLVGNQVEVIGEYINSITPILMHCDKGHTFEIRPNNFISRKGCPICRTKQQQLNHRLTNEQVVTRIFNKYRGRIELLSEYKSGEELVKYRCNKCGAVYEVRGEYILNTKRNLKCDCKQHNKNLMTDSEFKNRVYELVGDEYTPLSNYVNSATHILMKHNTNGNIFKVTPNNFLRGTRDPAIRMTRRKSQKYFEEEVLAKGGGNYIVCGKYIRDDIKIEFKNTETNTKFYMTPSNFLNGKREPNRTGISRGEYFISKYLSNKNVIYNMQYVILINNRHLRADFYLPKYNAFIEFDGEQHHEAVKLFGGEEALRKTQERDALKNAYAYEHGIKMIRIPYCYLNHIKEFLDPFFAKNEPIKK